MAYKIVFGENGDTKIEWYDGRKTARKWKEGKILNEIHILATGRNIRAKKKEKNVKYSLYDFAVFTKPRDKALTLEIVFDSFGKEPKLLDIILVRANTRTDTTEVFEALVLADKEYSKAGNGVWYKPRFSDNEDLLNKLIEGLNEAA